MHTPLNPDSASDKQLALHKFVLSFGCFALIAFIVVAAILRIDISYFVLAVMTLAFTFMTLRAVSVCRLAVHFRRAVRRYFHADRASLPPLQWRHVVVIPIYKEVLETIENTVEHLAQHRAAPTNYVILCAHEMKDPQHAEKLQHIEAKYRGRFREIIGSVHVLAPTECPGKAANVNFAVRSYAANLTEAEFASTMLTVIDCDTEVNEFYFYEVERQAAAARDPHATVYAAPTFFDMNRDEVPCFVRAMDDLWSLAAAANIFSNSGFGFPISNYTQSLKMLRDVDYWDVDHDAVGEDFHCFLKANAKLDGRVKLAPLAIPMNNEHVTGSGYVNSMLARYSQAMRHALGMCSTAYFFKYILHSRFSLAKWLILLLCLEAHLLPLLYFAAGWYVLASILVGDFFELFGGAKLTYFAVMCVSSFITTNAMFGLYKYVQLRMRRYVFHGGGTTLRNIVVGINDYFMQATCVMLYFLIPFGRQAFQNFIFKKNKVFYSKIEENLRTY